MPHDTRQQFDGLFSLYEWILGVTAVLFTAAIVLAALRYARRRRRGAISRRTENYPLELGYTFVLAGAVALLLFATFRTEDRIDRVSRASRTIEVIAFKWGWRITYPGERVIVVGDSHDTPTFAVPTGTTIRFTERSRDVVHSLWIPALRFKRDAWPDHDNTFDIVFSRVGTYVGRCAEFCGLEHASMTFYVRALPPAQFRTWLDEQRSGT